MIPLLADLQVDHLVRIGLLVVAVVEIERADGIQIEAPHPAAGGSVAGAQVEGVRRRVRVVAPEQAEAAVHAPAVRNLPGDAGLQPIGVALGIAGDEDEIVRIVGKLGRAANLHVGTVHVENRDLETQSLVQHPPLHPGFVIQQRFRLIGDRLRALGIVWTQRPGQAWVEASGLVAARQQQVHAAADSHLVVQADVPTPEIFPRMKFVPNGRARTVDRVDEDIGIIRLPALHAQTGIQRRPIAQITVEPAEHRVVA